MSIRPCLISSVYGKIEQVLLVQPGFTTAYSDLPFKRIRENYEAHGIQVCLLKDEMNGEARGDSSPRSIDLSNPMVAAMLAKSRAIEIDAKFDPRRWMEEFLTMKASGIPFAHSEWAQDGFCVQTYDDHYNILLQPLHSRRLMDQFVSMELAMKDELRFFVKPTLLELEGGNILVGDGFALVGQNTLGANWIAKLNGMKEEELNNPAFWEQAFDELLAQMISELGVESIIWVGYPAVRRDLFCGTRLTYQPDFHIDLFLTLGGKTSDGHDLLMIADPRLGSELIEKHLGIAVAHDLVWDDEPITDDYVFDSFFDDLHAQFRRHNEVQSERRFKVISMPMLIDRGIVYSYNNCLVEQYEDQLRVFLPNYINDDDLPSPLGQSEMGMNAKFEVLNQEVEQILRANGFTEVIWVGGGRQLQNFARRRGSLHCLTKVLRRSAYHPSSEAI